MTDAKGLGTYVAEVFRKPKTQRAGARGWWERIPGQANERLDLAVYARALFWRRGAFTRLCESQAQIVGKSFNATSPAIAPADHGRLNEKTFPAARGP